MTLTLPTKPTAPTIGEFNAVETLTTNLVQKIIKKRASGTQLPGSWPLVFETVAHVLRTHEHESIERDRRRNTSCPSAECGIADTDRRDDGVQQKRDHDCG